MKKMLAALLAAMMMLTLAACGGGSDTKTVDVQKLADDLKSNVPYSADMIATAVEDLNYKLDPPRGHHHRRLHGRRQHRRPDHRGPVRQRG